MWMDHCMEIHTVQLSTTRYHYLILLENVQQMWMYHCMEIHTVQLSTARYHYLILLENGDRPLWLSALQLCSDICIIIKTQITIIKIFTCVYQFKSNS